MCRSRRNAARFLHYLYPLLNTLEEPRVFESLRYACLGVVVALLKSDDPEVVTYLLVSNIMMLCLRVMEHDPEANKILATYIVQSILLDNRGLHHVRDKMFVPVVSMLSTLRRCACRERRVARVRIILIAVAGIERLADELAAKPSLPLLKLVIRCYLRLAESPLSADEMRSIWPSQLDALYQQSMDPDTKHDLEMLVKIATESR